MLDLISNLAKSLPWLREECGMVLCDSVGDLSKLPFGSFFVEACADNLKRSNLIKSPEGIALWLTIQAKFPNFEKFPHNIWAYDDPLHPQNIIELSKAMREQYEPKDGDGQENLKAGFWQQSVHFSWVLLLQTSITSSSEEINQYKQFDDVWKSLVDGMSSLQVTISPLKPSSNKTNYYSEGLFSEKSSLERRFWGLQLFSKLIPTVPVEVVRHMLSYNFIHNLVEHCSSNQKMLHEASKDCLKKIRARAEMQPELSEFMISRLISKPGTPFFDRITKTKTLEEIFSSADGKNFSKILKTLEHVMINQQGLDKKGVENLRQAVADLILAAFKMKAKKSTIEDLESSSWILKTITMFLRWSYCIPRSPVSLEDTAYLEVSSDTRAVFHSRLSSLLGQLLSSRLSNISHWSWQAVKKLKSITKSSKPYRMALQPDDSITEIIDRAYSFAKGIEDFEQNASMPGFGRAMSLLFCLLLLQAYSGDTDAITELEDLNACYQPISSSQQSGMHFELLLEILLGLLSKPSALFRSIVEHVFTAISRSVTENALQSLVDILQTPESLVGQNDLFQTNPTENEITAIGVVENDSELDSDVEMIDQTNGSSGIIDNSLDAEDKSDEEDSSDGKESSDDGEDDEELIQFNEKLAKVFRTSRVGDDDKSTNEESDDESMDDDQMMALDSQIVQVFRDRQIQTNKQKEKSVARQNVIAFKRRVLDLLSIYVRQETGNPLALRTLLPLLELIRTTKEKSLETKASDVLKLYYNTCSKNKEWPKPQDTGSTWEILRLIHSEAQKNGSKFHCSSCSRASLFVVRVLVSLDRKHYDKATEVYSTTQKTWFQKKSMVVQPTFFTEWISWSAEMRKQK